MKRTLIVIAAIVMCLGTMVQAQNTSNPYIPNTTNSVKLTAIANGFGVAVLGFPMPTPGTNFFADRLDGIALSDASSLNSTTLQFYAANEDNLIDSTHVNPFNGRGYDFYNVVGYRVLQVASDPNTMTVYKSWVAAIQTNSTPTSSSVDTNAIDGQGCAGTFGMGSVAKDGTIVIRMDGASAPASGMSGEAVVTFAAQLPTTVIVTDAVSLVDTPVAGVKVLAITSNTQGIPAIGQNANLVAKNNFGQYAYVCRADINPGNAGADAVSSNGQAFVASAAATDGSGASLHTINGFYDDQPNWGNTRGSIAHNDTAKMMVMFIKSTGQTAGTDQTGAIVTFKYTDAGGPITPTLFQTNVFGTIYATQNPISGSTGGYNTNAQYYFSRSGFAGPSQISINDSGAVAFAVSINCNNSNDATNGTRSAQVTGIIWQAPNQAADTGNFKKVVDNTDSSLFWQVPLSCTNKNLISSPAVDNFNNVYFEAGYSNNTAFACDLFPSNAVYEAVANDPYNPTAWTTRILLKQGDSFTDPVSGNLFKVTALPYNAGPGTRTTSQRSFGPTAVNRTQLPGHTFANTLPSDAFAVGGILVQATLTNITQGIGTDGLLYIAPYTACASLPFVVTSVTRSGNDFNLTYNAQTGTNIVQFLNGGNYANAGFADLTASTNIVTGCPASASFTDVGGATGTGNRYYRVRLIQP